MQGVTLTVAAIFSLSVLTLRPAYALAAFITSLLWYPSWLRVSIGTIDISAGRIVVSVLLLRCLCDQRIISKFTWSRLDTWVTLSMVVYVVVLCITLPLSYAIENRGGYLMDTWFAYIVARLIVTNKATIISVIKCVSIVLAPLAILGVIESISGRYLFRHMMSLSPWITERDWTLEPRWGLARAAGPIGCPIKFGCSLAIFLPLVYWLRNQKRYWRVLAYPLSGAVLIGALSSMSGGPWIMIGVAIFCLAIESRKNWVKPLLIFFVLSCVFIQITSNRDFHHVIISYTNPLGGSAGHRATLIDLAIEHFDEWWVIGYKGVDPGWGPRLGMVHTDVTNKFILNGVLYGIIGVIVLCLVLITSICSVVRLHKSTTDPELRSWAWALGSWFVVVIAGFMSVNFGGQLESLFYIILGMLGSSSSLRPSVFSYQNKYMTSLCEVSL